MAFFYGERVTTPRDVREHHEREAASYAHSSSEEPGWSQEQRKSFSDRAAFHRDCASAIRRLEEERDRLTAKLDKVATWLESCAGAAERRAKDAERFPAFAEANRKDAVNYRATAADLRRALSQQASEP